MPYIGDIYLPYVTENPGSQSRPVTEHNYVGFENSVSEFERSLENGSIPFVTTVDGHPEGYSLEVQYDAIRSLVKRDAPDNPIDFMDKRGHVSIESADYPRQARDTIREGNISVRYLPDSLYQPMFDIQPDIIPNDYALTPTGLFVLPDTVQPAYSRDTDTGEISIESPSMTISTVDGDLDYYGSVEGQYIYDNPESSYNEAIARGIVRAYRHNGSANDSNWSRVYTDEYRNDIVISNGLIRIVFNAPSDDEHHLQYYDASTWNDIGSLNLPATSQNLWIENSDSISVEIGDVSVALNRGHPTARVTVESQSTVTLDTSTGDNPIDSFTTQPTYVSGSSSSITEDYIVVSPSNDGNVSGSTADGTLEVSGLTGNREYTIPVGVVMSQMTSELVRDWSTTAHNLSRELFNRRGL